MKVDTTIKGASRSHIPHRLTKSVSNSWTGSGECCVIILPYRREMFLLLYVTCGVFVLFTRRGVVSWWSLVLLVGTLCKHLTFFFYAFTDVETTASTTVEGFYFWRWWEIQSKYWHHAHIISGYTKLSEVHTVRVAFCELGLELLLQLHIVIVRLVALL